MQEQANAGDDHHAEDDMATPDSAPDDNALDDSAQQIWDSLDSALDDSGSGSEGIAEVVYRDHGINSISPADAASDASYDDCQDTADAVGQDRGGEGQGCPRRGLGWGPMDFVTGLAWGAAVIGGALAARAVVNALAGSSSSR